MKHAIMTTQEVANRYCELANQNKWPEILDTEPEHVIARGIQPITRGLDAVKAKGEANREMIKEIHNQHCSAALVAGNFFSVALSRDITFKGKPRINLEEIAIFELKDDKIISEQFFY